MKKIKNNTTLADILLVPEAEKVLVKYNLPCLGCPFVQTEMESLKIGNVCKMYGIDSKSLLRELNEIHLAD